MADALATMIDGRTAFAYLESEGAGWHGKGQPLADNADPARWKAEGGFGFRIQKALVRFATARDQDQTQWSTYPGRVVLLRSDTKADLAIVGDGFQVVQPDDIFDTLVSPAVRAGFKLCTLGVLHGGRQFFAQVTDGTQAEIVPGDVVKQRTLLTTACDGSMKTTGKKCVTRVVCANTQAQALGEAGHVVRVSHRSRYDADAMQAALGLTHDSEDFGAYVVAMKRAADKQVSRDRAELLLFNLLADKKAKDDATKDGGMLSAVEKVSESLAFKSILSLFNGAGKGAGKDGVKGTGWGFINAVTEYADHYMRATSDDNRTDSAMWGKGAEMKDRAAQLIAALV